MGMRLCQLQTDYWKLQLLYGDGFITICNEWNGLVGGLVKLGWAGLDDGIWMLVRQPNYDVYRKCNLNHKFTSIFFFYSTY